MKMNEGLLLGWGKIKCTKKGGERSMLEDTSISFLHNNLHDAAQL